MSGAVPPGFADGKDPEALRTIGEVAKALGIRQHVLRYWEEQFPMLRPLKRGGGRRYYRPEDIRMVETIDRLVHHEGYTLKGAAGRSRKTGVGCTRNACGQRPGIHRHRRYPQFCLPRTFDRAANHTGQRSARRLKPDPQPLEESRCSKVTTPT
jgi:hypothetical protein